MQQLESDYVERLESPWFCTTYKNYIPSTEFLLNVCFCKNCPSIINLYRLHFSRKLYQYFIYALSKEGGCIECTPPHEETMTQSLIVEPEPVPVVETPVEVPAHLKILSIILTQKR